MGAGTGPYTVGNRPAGEGDPDPRPESSPVLVVEDPDDPGQWVTRELDRAMRGQELTQESVSSLGEDPDQRQLLDDEGRPWSLERIGEPAAAREDADFEDPPRTLKVTGEVGRSG